MNPLLDSHTQVVEAASACSSLHEAGEFGPQVHEQAVPIQWDDNPCSETAPLQISLQNTLAS